jgi:hypothetical protein
MNPYDCPRTIRPTTPVIGRPSGGSGHDDGLPVRVTRVFSFTAVIAPRTRTAISGLISTSRLGTPRIDSDRFRCRLALLGDAGRHEPSADDDEDQKRSELAQRSRGVTQRHLKATLRSHEEQGAAKNELPPRRRSHGILRRGIRVAGSPPVTGGTAVYRTPHRIHRNQRLELLDCSSSSARSMRSHFGQRGISALVRCGASRRDDGHGINVSLPRNRLGECGRN